MNMRAFMDEPEEVSEIIKRLNLLFQNVPFFHTVEFKNDPT